MDLTLIQIYIRSPDFLLIVFSKNDAFGANLPLLTNSNVRNCLTGSHSRTVKKKGRIKTICRPDFL